MVDARNWKRWCGEVTYLDPKIERVVALVHMRDKDNRGRCGIVGARLSDEPSFTDDPSLVTCPRCLTSTRSRGRRG